MKFKEIGQYNGDIISTILINRGITDIELFLNPDNSSDTDIEKITNIYKGISLIEKNINNNICILVDCDCDGITSSSIMYQTLKIINPDANITYYLHSDKKHGFTDNFMEFIGNHSFDLIIVPDAGTNDTDKIDTIVDIYKADVLIIDHHPVEKTTDKGVIINNQICNNTNGNLTGAGLTYLFCKLLGKQYSMENEINKLSDLALLGLVGDSADLTENEVRNICSIGINNINNRLIKAFYGLNGKDINNLIIKDLSFSGIIPLINAIVRVGTLEEKDLLFSAISNILNPNELHIITKKKLNKYTRKYEMIDFTYNAYENMVEVGLKVKARQDKLSKDAMKLLKCQVNNKSSIQIFILDDASDETKGITGLIANKLSSLYKQPCIVVWLDKGEPDKDGKYDEDNFVYNGSLRGNIEILPDFKRWCLDTELFVFVQGHPNAAGLSFPYKNYDQLVNLTNKVEAIEYIHYVDRIYNNKIDIADIYDVDAYKSLWYGGCEEPLFAVRDIKVNKSLIQLNKSTLKFYMNGVSYIKFRSTDDYNKIVLNGFSEDVTLNLIGRLDINNYNGKQYPQFIIEDYEIVERPIFEFGGSEVSSYGMFA